MINVIQGQYNEIKLTFTPPLPKELLRKMQSALVRVQSFEDKSEWKFQILEISDK